MASSDDAFTVGRRVLSPLPPVFDDAVSGLSAAGAIARLRAVTAEQNRLEAERSAVLTRLYELRDDDRRVREESSRRFVDDWDELVAEVGAALGVGRAAAGAAVHRGLDLRERCPRLFGLFASGAVGLAVVREVLRSSAAIIDERVAAVFDERIAGWLAARTGQCITVRAVADAAKAVLARIDPDAAREVPPAPPRERLDFHARADGLVDLEAVMPNDQVIRLAAVLEPIVETVCREDGRTPGQRWTAGLVALAEGYATLGCECGREDCALREARPRTGAVSQEISALAVIVLNESDLPAVADARSGNGTGRRGTSGAGVGDEAPVGPDLFTPDVVPESGVRSGTESDSQHDAEGGSPPGGAPARPSDADVCLRDGNVPPVDAAENSTGAVVLTGARGISGPTTVERARALIAAARVRWRVLGRRDPATGEVHLRGAGGYRPTWYQQLVLRLTYPTCVFPGCSVPSDRCQIDHVAEYDHADPAAGGPTTVAGAHGPGNLVPLCGFHHRIKTETGWLSDLLPDGTVEWRHPAGGVHTVPPGAARGLLPGMDRIVWDAPELPTRAPSDSDGLASAAARRAKARRELRARNRILRHRREEQESVDAENRARERERARAADLGEPYDETAPLAPPPF